jgi:hypothetical protein
MLPIGDAPFAINPFLNTPQLPQNHHLFYESNGVDPIYVYPDIIRGNPMHGKRVVRWLLAEAGKYGGDSVFPETDKIYGYTTPIAKSAGTKNVLLLPTFDRNVFFDNDSTRSGACYYAHKYDRIHGNVLPDIVKDAMRLSGKPETISAILRQSEVCYVLEMSEIIINAQLCGCKVILVRTPYFDSIPRDIDFPYWNVTWDDGSSIQTQPHNFWAKDGMASFEDGMRLLDMNYKYQFNRFIEETQSWR